MLCTANAWLKATRDEDMLTVHHLRKSQSERIVWLCEELGLTYRLRCYDREPTTKLAPPEYKALHPVGAAPVITEGDLVLAESGAIVSYIIEKHAGGRLALGPLHPDFAQYLYWLNFANGTLQPSIGRSLVLQRLQLPSENAILIGTKGRLNLALQHLDARLGSVPYLAGSEFTAADIMTVFSLTTMRHFAPYSLDPLVEIKAYLNRIGNRDAYRRAMEKGDPGVVPMLS